MSGSTQALEINVSYTGNNEVVTSDQEYSDEDYGCDYDDDMGYDDFNAEDSTDENNIYLNDPERFEYECYDLEKIDWIVETKCRQLIDRLSLEDPINALDLLRKFKWNVQTIVDCYDQDKQSFLQTYFSDNNNNSQITATSSNCNKSKLLSYVNIFRNDSKIFASVKEKEAEKKDLKVGLICKKFDTYCDICCMNQLDTELGMAAAIDECGHLFCRECWRTHFEALINESFWNRFAATSKTFQCMATGCKEIASKDFVLNCLKYNINNNEDNYSAGTTKATTTSNYTEDVPLWRKALSTNTARPSLSDRYKQLVAIDLVKESEDIQLCPGEIQIIQEKPRTKTMQPPSSQVGSPSFNNFLMNTLATPPTTSSYLNAKLLQSAKPNQNVTKSPMLLSSSYPNTSQLGKKMEMKNEKPCLTRKCDSIVWIKGELAAKRVTCTCCSCKYCFLCLLPYHAPNSCATIKKWLSKCQDDSETRNYLLVHTQDCPKCHVCIEKNGGCSHMTCNRCKHEFCWVCSNDWKSHGASYDCNRYKGNPEQDSAREALNRYTHYYHRWVNHSNSLKFEKAFKEQCQLKIQEKIMNKEGGTLVDWEFLTEAVEHLTRARYTLQYTYPFAFYLDEDESKKMLFENIQAELERDVENLSHSLENVSLNDKFNIESQMNIVEKRRKTLLLDFNS